VRAMIVECRTALEGAAAWREGTRVRLEAALGSLDRLARELASSAPPAR